MNNANVNMGGMNPMQPGPVMGGGPVPMMPGNMVMGQQPQPQPGQPHMQPPQQPIPQPQMGQQPGMQMPPRTSFTGDHHRLILNTYIYEYFLRMGMTDCARALLDHNPAGVQTVEDENHGNNGEAMDTDNKDEIKSSNLPEPKVPMSSDTSFLLEWFAVFWDIYGASKGSKQNVPPFVNQYVAHTQARGRQASQADLLRSVRDAGSQQIYGNMLRQPNNTMLMKPGHPGLMRAAMNGNMLAQQQQKMAINREGGMDGGRDRPSSPGGDVTQSPSKKQRLDFNNGQTVMINGRPAMMGQQGPGGPNGTNQMLLASGINPSSLSVHQMQQFNNSNQSKSIATYAATLQHHHGAQMPNKQMPGGPQGQGSPMMQPGPDGSMAMYNAEMAQNGLRPPQGPGPNGPGGQSNHALQDYQMQLMMLEQQNKKRLLIARQEQDNMGGMLRPDGQNPPGPNGQSFTDGSPQNKTGNSPNPTDLKRTGSGVNGSISSPVPTDGTQNQGSPNQMGGFMGGNEMPNGLPNNQHGFMVPPGHMNSMRPSSSHPPFNPNMNPQQQQQQQQQMMQVRQQQQQGGGPNQQSQWQQNGMNTGNPMMQPGQQPGQQPGSGPGGPQGTPQQRSMPPPSAPNNIGNNRTSTSSPQLGGGGTPAPPTPQQATKAAPKKKESKSSKSKSAAQKKGGAAAGATPAADANNDESAPPTPITPAPTTIYKGSGPQPSGPTPTVPSAQSGPAGNPTPISQSQPEPSNTFADSSANMVGFGAFELADPLNTDNVLEGFDFDAFIQTDGDGGDSFDFGNFTSIDGEPLNAD